MTEHRESTHALIHHFIEQSARSRPLKTALVQGGLRATYEEINRKANSLAHFLLKRGITDGQRVVLLLENGFGYVVSYYAVLKSGSVAVPLNGDIKPAALRALLTEIEPSAIISSARFEKVLKETDLSLFDLKAFILKEPSLDWPKAPCGMYPWEGLTGGLGRDDPRLPMDPARSASIIYTSGSNGTPKGVVLSHRNIVSNTHDICASLRLSERDVQMVVLPFFYVMGKSLLNTHFAVGGTLVIHNAFAYTASVVRQMVDERVTGLSGVPSTYTHLLYRSPLEKYREKLTSLRYCAQAGGHMPRRVKEELRRVLPEHTDIYIMYGATEAGARLTCLEPGRFADKMDSIGKPLQNVTLRVIDEGGRECPDGQTGELVASGPNIMRGYWKDSEGTARVLNEKGYRTGDMGFRDSEGFYYLVGRRDHLIKVSGHRINPHEVEDALLSTGLLLETVVFAVPDPISGEKMVALATLKNGDCTGTDILCGCTERLPRYKIPKEVKIVRGLPKNSHGKIDLSRCREIMAGNTP